MRPRNSSFRPGRTIRAVALAALAGLVCAPPAGATFAGHGGRIAYETLDPSGGVFVVRADGRHRHEVVRNAQWMQWSPGGSRLVFARSFGNGGLWWSRPDGTHKRPILRPTAQPNAFGGTSYQTWSPSWSPDGRSVAFAALLIFPRGEGERDVFHICTIDVDGRHLRTLHLGADPAWSPDGGFIAFVRSERLMVMRPDGSGVRTVFRPRPGSGASEPDFSPDGRRIAFVAQGPRGHRTLHVANLRTGRSHSVRTTPPGSVVDVAWTGNGARVAYLLDPPQPPRTRAKPTELHTVRPDGTRNRLRFSLGFSRRFGMWADHLALQTR